MTEQRQKGNRTSTVLWATFLFAASVVTISIIPAIFPALYSSFVTTNHLEEFGISGVPVDYFEMGISSSPLIAANTIILILGILYWKKRLPKTIKRAIDFVFAFETSKRVTAITLLAILSVYIATAAPDIATPPSYADWEGVEKRLQGWSLDSISGWDVHVRYFLLSSSMYIFGSYKVIPFIASLGLLLTVFFMTKRITGKRFAGLAAIGVMLQSNIFLTYDTSATYTNFWILFYLLSLYLIYRAWPLAHASFLLSIPSKALTAAFFPMSFYFMWRSEMPKGRKIIIMGTFAGMLVAGIAAVSSFTTIGVITTATEFNASGFWAGFTSFATQFRFDLTILMFILPVIVGLFLVARNGSKQAESILFILGWLLLLAPLLDGFTSQQNQPYRFMPLVAFFAIGVGTLLSRPKAT